MEELSGVTIYWLISIGLLVGFVIDLIMMKRGISLIGNVIWGAVGSVIIGVIMIVLNVFGPLIYAAVGSIAFLFLINVFSFDQEHKDSARAN
ncbi:hypothetical protein [Rhodohalobacter sp. 8-1]|uniref:hypothetical protein n=1 Tax=Rhodohalobacter sp. 8-1 TaxID=3131972 RepID=UPI0030EE355B